MDIAYKLIRSSRRSLCLEIIDGELIVRSPYFASVRTIEKFIDKKSAWIEKTLSIKEKRLVRQYGQGEAYLILGHQYFLEVINHSKRGLEIRGNKIILKTPLQDRETIKIILNRHYRQLTSKIVKRYLSKYGRYFPLENPNFKVKFYLSKWGSCSPNNILSFSAKLAMTPPEVIEYVVVHELAHLKYKHHQKEFWQEVGKLAPNHREARRWIRLNHHKLVL